ncbi:MAG: hypothetical protein AAF945_04530 [Actinomycetota bacterium]
MTTPRRRATRLVAGAFTGAMAIGSAIVGLPTSAPIASATGALQTIDLETPGSGEVVIGSLASRSQRGDVTIAGIGPYTITGTDATSGDPYTFVTDAQYFGPTDGGRDAYTRESQYRGTSSGLSTSFDEAASFGGRNGIVELTSSGNCPSGNTDGGPGESYCSAFGPDVYSEAFDASVGQSVTFDWAAVANTDDYEIYAFLVEVTETSPGVYDYGSPASHTLLTYGRGENQTWITASGEVPNAGSYRFRFVNGTYDGTGLLAIGSDMYIDSVVRVGLSNPIDFPQPGDKIVTDGTFELSATATSPGGGPVTFQSLNTGICTVSGTTVTPVSVGTCPILADHPGDGVDYVPAPSVSRSIQILNAATAPSNSGLPLIQGTPEDGGVVTATEGTWNDGGSPITGTTTVWKNNGTALSNIPGSGCVLIADAGGSLTFEVTKTNAVGSTPAESAPLAGYTCFDGPIEDPDSDVEPPATDGGTVTVTGRNFKPGSTVQIVVDGVVVGTETADAEGNVSADITPPEGTQDYEVKLSGTSLDNRAIETGKRLVTDLSGTTSVVPDDQGYLPITPTRVLDTRSGDRLASGATQRIAIDASWNVPGTATAVAINVAAVQGAGVGFLTIHGCESERPLASAVNFQAGTNKANLVIVEVDDSNEVCIYTNTAVHLVVDANGYFSPDLVDRVGPSTPVRLLDTRDGAKVAAGGLVEVQVTGDGLAPAGAVAAVLNVAAPQADSLGFLTVYDCAEERPLASNVNYDAGLTTANLVFAELSDDGRVCIYSSQSTHLVVDLNGAFESSQTPVLVAHTPARFLDTRDGAKVAAGSTVRLELGTDSGLEDVGAYAINLTSAQSIEPGYATVYPCTDDRPEASSINFGAGIQVANHVTAKPGTDGAVCIYVSAATHLVVDVTGVYL